MQLMATVNSYLTMNIKLYIAMSTWQHIHMIHPEPVPHSQDDDDLQCGFASVP